MTLADRDRPAAEGRLHRLADRVGGIGVRARLGLAALAGGFSTAALPPADAWPLGFVAFTLLLLLLDGVRGRLWPGFWTGWAFGLGQFAAGLYWIGVAFFVDAAAFGALAVPSVLGLSAGLAIFTGLVGVVQARAAPQGPGRVLFLAVAWIVAEWLRGHILTGFPWNLTGASALAVPALAQGAAIVGTYGMGLLAVAVFAAPALLLVRGPEDRRPALMTGGLILAVLLGTGVWGTLRLETHQTATVPGVKLRLVQAAIDQKEKWRGGMKAQHLRTHLDLTRGPGFDTVTDVIWPETAIGYYPQQEAEIRKVLARAVPPGGLLITGAPRVEWTPPPAGSPPGTEPQARVFNSVMAIDDQARILGVYDKAHLVPFGEYVPLRELNPFPKLTAGSIDFTPGPGPATLALPGLPPVSPLICYEAIFPGEVTAGAATILRPGFLLNVTNDGWFGLTAGPHQHFASARLRSIEEGLPLVRAANNGISAIVDPLGRVIALLELDRRGVLDGPLPTALPPTLYARVGDGSVAVVGLIVLVLAFLLRVPRRRN